MTSRADGRADDQLREIRLTRHWQDHPAGSVLVEFGRTRVLCAATFTEGLVPHEEKVERMQRLVELVQRNAHERAQRFVGRTMEVLIEGPSRTDPTRLRGRTRHNKAVNFEGAGEPGTFTKVRITGATSQTLTGEQSLVDLAALAG